MNDCSNQCALIYISALFLQASLSFNFTMFCITLPSKELKMTLYLHLILVVISLATLSTTQDLKINFRCHSKDFNEDSMNYLKEDCRLKTANPLKRPCIEGCILNNLGLLGIVFNTTKNRDSGYGSTTTFVSVELEDLMSDNQDLAEALQKNVEEKCGAIMKKTILEDKKTCEEWDPIYTCVQAASCAAGIATIDQIFPDFRCYHGYKRGPAREDHEQCIKDIEQPFNKNCYKACMLQRFGIFEFSMSEGEPVSKLGEIGSEEDGYYGGLVSELQWRLKGNEELSISLGKRIHNKCGHIFQKTVVEQKKSCEEWDPFYDCITDAVGCK